VIIKDVCQIVRPRWDNDRAVLDSAAIMAYTAASQLTSPMEAMPSLDASWQAAVHQFRMKLADEDASFMFDTSTLDEFWSLIEAVRNGEPRFLRRIGFPEECERDFKSLLDSVNRELSSSRHYTSREGYDSEADASFALGRSLKRIYQLLPDLKTEVDDEVLALSRNANRCRERYAELSSEQDEDDVEPVEEFRSGSEYAFSIETVFADL
jgi:hypothetical protein